LTAASLAPPPAVPLIRRLGRLVRGLATTALVAAASIALVAAETRVFGRAVVEPLVAALVLGMLIRLAWRPGEAQVPGIRFAGKEVLEVSVVLLGMSVDLPLLLRAGPVLAIGIVIIVGAGLAVGIGIGRLLGLDRRLAILVACGNAICGNSAIVAVAPVIGAEADDVASSIAFTAMLGVIAVLALPLAIDPLRLTHYEYGVLAGMTVYSVPQVLAAAFPVSALSGEVATLVKLVRVLMLGPVVLMFVALQAPGRRVPSRQRAASSALHSSPVADRPRATTLVPWFIVGFLVLATMRAAGVIPASWVAPTRTVSTWLTIIAMAALGLSADLRAVARAGSRVATAASASLLLLIGLAVAIIRVLRIG
jgi:uncharacterized integral membrane protein (TIGR00698 family)